MIDTGPFTLGKKDWQVGIGLLDPHGNRTNGIWCNLLGPHVPIECAKAEGHRGYNLAYQPADRFWPYQWIETGVYLAISALEVAVTVWLVVWRLG
jgi:hypothetical protein